MAHHDKSMWPMQTDTDKVLQDKYDRNMTAAWGEIGMDLAFPNRESDVTDYQANAMKARGILEQREEDGLVVKCERAPLIQDLVPDEIDEIPYEIEYPPIDDIEIPIDDRPCIWSQLNQFLMFLVGYFVAAQLAVQAYIAATNFYLALKIAELPLLANPATAWVYATH